MIEIHNLSFNRGKKSILKNINMKISKGRLTALLGPNGAGKSTLLKLLTRELLPNQGKILFNAINIAKIPVLELAKMRSVMPQTSLLSFDFTVLEVVLLGRTPYHQKDDINLEIAISCLDKLECLHLKDRCYTSLSKGEQQRINLARVLAQATDEKQQLLLLDEPVASLDPEYQLKMLSVAKEMAQKGFAVFIILHDLNMAAAYADIIAFIKQGELRYIDETKKVLQVGIIREIFNIDVSLIQHKESNKIFINTIV